MLKAGLIKSKSEGRRLIEQAGVAVNDAIIDDIGATVTEADFEDSKLLIKKGLSLIHI